jgi:hypothetical protein
MPDHFGPSSKDFLNQTPDLNTDDSWFVLVWSLIKSQNFYPDEK